MRNNTTFVTAVNVASITAKSYSGTCMSMAGAKVCVTVAAMEKSPVVTVL